MEIANKNTEPIIPNNIDELIPGSLIPATNRVDRGVFFIEDHQDLCLRTNYYPDTFEAAKQSWGELTAAGVNMVPYVTSEYGGNPIVLTSRVSGVSLAEALEESPTDEIVDEFDSNWKGVLDYLVACKQNGKPVAADILQDPSQFMYGTLPGQTDPHVFCIDLTDEALSVADIAVYATEVMGGANVISYIENIAGRKLPKARDSLARAIEILEAATDQDYAESDSMTYLDKAARELQQEYLRALPNAARYAVEHHAIIKDDDPRITDLPLVSELS